MNKKSLHKLLTDYIESPKGIESQQKLAVDLQKHIKENGRCCYTLAIEEELSKFVLDKFKDEDSFREYLKSIDKAASDPLQ